MWFYSLCAFSTVGQLIILTTDKYNILASLSERNSSFIRVETTLERSSKVQIKENNPPETSLLRSIKIHNKENYPSCEGKCGRIWKTQCSCHRTCSIYNLCCPDFLTKCPEVKVTFTASSQVYVYPEFWCMDNGVLIISSCNNDTSRNNTRGVQLMRSSENKEIFFEATDKTNIFPVTDLATGFIYINWSTFLCFSQHYSKPLILAAHVNDIKIQRMESYLYTVLSYKHLLFEFPKITQVLFSTCEYYPVDLQGAGQVNDEITEKAKEYPDCAQCKGHLKIFRNELDYPITVIPNMSHLYITSTDKSKTWSELSCKAVDPENTEVNLTKNLFCKIIKYKSSFFKRLGDNMKRLYIFKMALNVKSYTSYNTELFGQIVICFLRNYANIDAIGTWRPTSLTYSPIAHQYFLVMKVLIYDNIIFQPEDVEENRKMFNVLTMLKNYLIANAMIFTSRRYTYDAFQEQDAARNYDELIDLEGIEFFQQLNSKSIQRDIVCTCSTSLDEIHSAKYLDSWVCSVKCDWFTSVEFNYTYIIATVNICKDIHASSRAVGIDSFKFYLALLMLFVVLI